MSKDPWADPDPQPGDLDAYLETVGDEFVDTYEGDPTATLRMVDTVEGDVTASKEGR